MWSSLHDPAKPLLDYLASFYDELLAQWYSEVYTCIIGQYIYHVHMHSNHIDLKVGAVDYEIGV